MKGVLGTMRRMSTTALPRSSFDVLLVGGGPTGGVLACALATHPRTRHLSVGVLDAQPHRSSSHTLREWPDARVLALSPASVALLQSCGVWDAVLASGRATPYYDMHVRDARSGDVSFRASDADLPYLGFIVEHPVLCDALYARMAALDKSVTLLPPQNFDAKSLPRHELLLGCDGATSAVRKHFGISAWGRDYDQRAVCSAVKVEDADFISSTALQRFTPAGGCVALLPSMPGHLSLVYTVPSTAAPALLAMDGAALARAVQKEMGVALLKDMPALVECVGPRGAPPLRIQTASRYTGEAMALVGDAAHTVHPMAGQGYNLALADVTALVEALGWAVATGTPLSGSATLERYKRQAMAHDSLAMATIHTLWSTMQLNGSWFSSLRALGMSAVNNATPVKRLLVQQAAGASFMANNTWQ